MSFSLNLFQQVDEHIVVHALAYNREYYASCALNVWQTDFV